MVCGGCYAADFFGNRDGSFRGHNRSWGVRRRTSRQRRLAALDETVGQLEDAAVGTLPLHPAGSFLCKGRLVQVKIRRRPSEPRPQCRRSESLVGQLTGVGGGRMRHACRRLHQDVTHRVVYEARCRRRGEQCCPLIGCPRASAIVAWVLVGSWCLAMEGFARDGIRGPGTRPLLRGVHLSAAHVRPSLAVVAAGRIEDAKVQRGVLAACTILYMGEDYSSVALGQPVWPRLVWAPRK